ncbi:MAG: cellulase family glycosylhydrolase, partial [Chloroflexia bacterium]|nr:cellulase family glycosylhydrolase [Chloroflexia bacterium]
MYLDGPWFKDEHGRTLLLRGLNLGGSSKMPYRPDGATHRREGFFQHRDVSFVGRPFPLEEADEHFSRLRAWGLTFLRFLVTWEAIEHAGPGLYDRDYLDYLQAVVAKAGEYGLQLFIDPHQDVWSRFCGGDGAPGWTLEAAGLDMTHFAQTGAAIVHATHGDPFPRMIWPSNDGKLATATMFTLFFGGSDFAPTLQVDGEPIQEFLQRHYIAALQQVALRLRGIPHVLGYDTMNEPSAGYIGLRDLRQPFGMLVRGDAPTALQGMLLGAGYVQEVGR